MLRAIDTTRQSNILLLQCIRTDRIFCAIYKIQENWRQIDEFRQTNPFLHFDSMYSNYSIIFRFKSICKSIQSWNLHNKTQSPFCEKRYLQKYVHVTRMRQTIISFSRVLNQITLTSNEKRVLNLVSKCNLNSASWLYGSACFFRLHFPSRLSVNSVL